MATKPTNTSITQSEPALTYGTIVAAIAAAFTVAKTFGLPLTEDQENAILQFLTILGPIITAVIIRQKVYSPDTTQKIADHAAETGDSTIEPPPAK